MQLATVMPLPANPKKLVSSTCFGCNRQRTCLAHSLENEELAAFDSIVKHTKKLKKGEFLYRAGEPSETIYTVRSGSLKTFIIDEEGREQILGFSVQGDVVGLDGEFNKEHPTSAQTLEPTYVCSIPLNRYLELAVKIPSLYSKLLTTMSNRIYEEEEHALLLGTKSADQRLATLLLNLSKRNAARGFSSINLDLHMSRRDIGNYLSAAVETVSRLFTRLQSLGVIEVHGKRVKITDLDKLQKLAS